MSALLEVTNLDLYYADGPSTCRSVLKIPKGEMSP